MIDTIHFFTLCQKKWANQCPHNAEVQLARCSNSENGGSCSIFLLIQELKNSLLLPKNTVEKLICSLKPDQLNSRMQIQDNRPPDVILRDHLNFTLTKINRALALKNKTVEEIFKAVSHDNVEDFVPVNILMKHIELLQPMISEEEKSKLI